MVFWGCSICSGSSSSAGVAMVYSNWCRGGSEKKGSSVAAWLESTSVTVLAMHTRRPRGHGRLIRGAVTDVFLKSGPSGNGSSQAASEKIERHGKKLRDRTKWNRYFTCDLWCSWIYTWSTDYISLYFRIQRVMWLLQTRHQLLSSIGNLNVN